MGEGKAFSECCHCATSKDPVPAGRTLDFHKLDTDCLLPNQAGGSLGFQELDASCQKGVCWCWAGAGTLLLLADMHILTAGMSWHLLALPARCRQAAAAGRPACSMLLAAVSQDALGVSDVLDMRCRASPAKCSGVQVRSACGLRARPANSCSQLDTCIRAVQVLTGGRNWMRSVAQCWPQS